MDNDDLVERVRENAGNYLGRRKRSSRVLAALAEVDRRDFIPYRKVDAVPIDFKDILEMHRSFSTIERDSLTAEQKAVLGQFSNGLAYFMALVEEVREGHVITGIDEFTHWKYGFYPYFKGVGVAFPDAALPQFDEITMVVDRIIRAPVTRINVRELSYMDCPLPIGYEQTCSQPSMVAFMADLLRLESGMHVLEVGTGCGYSAAVVKHLIGPGMLTSIEYDERLHNLAARNLGRHFKPMGGITLVHGDGSIGYQVNAPFDRIYLTAGAKTGFDPHLLLGQIEAGGILLYPEEDGRMIFQRQGGVRRTFYEGVSFVPLLGENT